MDSEQLACRVTVSVGGYPTGSVLLIDPSDEWMQVYLTAGWLVPLKAESVEGEPAAAPELHTDDDVVVPAIDVAPDPVDP